MTALVVDDEALARRALVQQLETFPEVDLIEECGGGAEAIERLHAGGVDLLFLDVAMPGVDGFDVVRRVGRRALPPVVFVTAYDRHAVQAFDERALDYLLKPVSRERLRESLERALEARPRALDDVLPTPPADTGRLVIRLGGRTTLVPHADVLWIEAASSYVRIHTRTRTHLLRASLADLERSLEPAGFLRVHRSALVRLAAIVELRHLVRGDYELLLSDGTRVRASRRRRAALLARLGR